MRGGRVREREGGTIPHYAMARMGRRRRREKRGAISICAGDAFFFFFE